LRDRSNRVRTDALPIHVHYNAGRVSLSGGARQDAVITAELMLSSLLEGTSQRSIDLIAIATGVYAIDRVCKRKANSKNECGVRTHSVEFEVVDLKFWTRPRVTEQLIEILRFLTGDIWFVSFVQRNEPHGGMPQRKLALNETLPTRLGLFSGGLDSAAGLANKLVAGEDSYMLLTVGHHASVRRRSKWQVDGLRRIRPGSVLNHAAFMVHFDGGVAGRLKRQETTQRARGFLFCAAAAILAAACKIEDIDLFENGIGALNLPLTEGSMSDGLSTRGAHPGFLRKMGLFVSEVLDQPIRYNLPFFWHTKAEMIKSLAETPRIEEWLHQSSSCIHTSLRERGKRHCGHCAACIERRQAFQRGDMEDNVGTYQVDLLSSGQPKELQYLLTYIDNARRWSTGDERLRDRLARFQILSDITHLSIESLEQLLIRHAHESLLTYGKFQIRDAA
jgi:Predicted PP-loop superfamily ATPase